MPRSSAAPARSRALLALSAALALTLSSGCAQVSEAVNSDTAKACKLAASALSQAEGGSIAPDLTGKLRALAPGVEPAATRAAILDLAAALDAAAPTLGQPTPAARAKLEAVRTAAGSTTVECAGAFLKAPEK